MYIVIHVNNDVFDRNKRGQSRLPSRLLSWLWDCYIFIYVLNKTCFGMLDHDEQICDAERGIRVEFLLLLCYLRRESIKGSCCAVAQWWTRLLKLWWLCLWTWYCIYIFMSVFKIIIKYVHLWEYILTLSSTLNTGFLFQILCIFPVLFSYPFVLFTLHSLGRFCQPTSFYIRICVEIVIKDVLTWSIVHLANWVV